MPRKPLVGLVMIVKDGEETLRRTLNSVRPYIGYWTICDTGSTDSSKEIVGEILGDLPGRLYNHKWRNFAYNRNLALARAKEQSRWLLCLDDDMAITYCHEGTFDWLDKNPDPACDAWYVTIAENREFWRLPLLIRGGLRWRYVGAVHEYLHSEGRKHRPILGLTVGHFPDGKGDVDKFRRYIELLNPGYKAHEPRDTFYMAQTLRFSGNHEAARLVYEERTRLGGYDEERWYATYQVAALSQDVEGLIACWRARPWRHEPLSAAGRIVHRTAQNGDLLFLEQPN